MSSRPILAPFSVVTNGDMSSQIVSEVTIIQNISMISYDISWSDGSTPVGDIEVQVSNTYSKSADGSVKNEGNWTALTLSSATSISGNSGNGFIDVKDLASYAIRLVYIPTSGSGTLNVTATGKVK